MTEMHFVTTLFCLFVCCVFVLWDRALLCSSGTYYADQTGLNSQNLSLKVEMSVVGFFGFLFWWLREGPLFCFDWYLVSPSRPGIYDSTVIQSNLASLLSLIISVKSHFQTGSHSEFLRSLEWFSPFCLKASLHPVLLIHLHWSKQCSVNVT